jgi:hypothetical protein
MTPLCNRPEFRENPGQSLENPHLSTVGVFLAACATSNSGQDPCVFPGPPLSAIAANASFTSDRSFRGRVVDTALDALPAVVKIEPGGHITQADSDGRFRFVGIARGRYFIRVTQIGFAAAGDSVTYGEYGLELVAILASTNPGLMECVRPIRKS